MIALALVLQFAIALAVAAMLLLHRGASAFHPLALYLLFHLLVFVVRPALVHFAGFDGQWLYMGFQPDPAGFVRTLAVASLGLLAFAAASLAAGGPAPPARPRELAPTPAQRHAFWLTAAVLLPPALLGAHLDLGLFARPLAGAEDVRRDAATGYTVFVGTSAYLVKAHNLLLPLAVLAVAVGRFRAWAYLPLLLVLAFRVYLGSRWGVVLACGMLLLLHLHAAGRAWPAARWLALALPLLVVFHLVGEDRSALRGLSPEAPAPHVRPLDRAPAGPLDPLDRPDFANFDYLAYVVDRVPARTGTYSYFTQYSALLTQPIPRVLWPDKPVGPPVKLVELNAHGRFAGRTRSLPGDGWMSLGWAGVAVTMAAAGALLGGAHRLYRRHVHQLFPVLAYCALLPVTLLWFRGGMIASLGRIGLWMLLPILLWWALSRALAALERGPDTPDPATVVPFRRPR